MSVSTDEIGSRVNPFVTRLLRLQQDGKEAISGPANWREPPLLEVATDSDDAIDALLDAMCTSPGDARHHGRWHWLVGSPGNGKSAKLGLLARRLLERGYKIVSEDGVAVGESNADWLPYLLEVREEGRLTGLPTSCRMPRSSGTPSGATLRSCEDLATFSGKLPRGVRPSCCARTGAYCSACLTRGTRTDICERNLGSAP